MILCLYSFLIFYSGTKKSKKNNNKKHKEYVQSLMILQLFQIFVFIMFPSLCIKAKIKNVHYFYFQYFSLTEPLPHARDRVKIAINGDR